MKKTDTITIPAKYVQVGDYIAIFNQNSMENVIYNAIINFSFVTFVTSPGSSEKYVDLEFSNNEHFFIPGNLIITVERL